MENKIIHSSLFPITEFILIVFLNECIRRCVALELHVENISFLISVSYAGIRK